MPGNDWDKGANFSNVGNPVQQLLLVLRIHPLYCVIDHLGRKGYSIDHLSDASNHFHSQNYFVLIIFEVYIYKYEPSANIAFGTNTLGLPSHEPYSCKIELYPGFRKS